MEETADPDPNSNPTQIFILSGQSNMAGRGGVTKHHHWDGVVPPDCHPHPSILRLSSKLQWEPAREPLHCDIDSKKVCGVGPGMSFANKVIQTVPGERVGLVPCAVGGTAIKEWARGEKLYENMVMRSKESVKSGGEIKCLLWYQGESDTSHQHDADTYGKNMEVLISNVREDLGLPSLPIIQVAIISGDKRYMEKVREAQLGMKVENVVCVDAKGLELKEDHLHLTTGAQVKLGHMLADAYLKYFVGSDLSSKWVRPSDDIESKEMVGSEAKASHSDVIWSEGDCSKGNEGSDGLEEPKIVVRDNGDGSDGGLPNGPRAVVVDGGLSSRPKRVIKEPKHFKDFVKH